MRRFAVPVIAALVLSAALTAANATTYVLKQDRPKVGSSITHTLTKGQLPYDKRWGDLTPEQQTLVRQGQPELPASDNPPFPAEGLGPMYRKLIDGIWQLQLDGPVKLRVKVDADGRATDVDVLACPGGAVAEKFASGIFLLTPYSPGTCSGRPCAKSYLVDLVIEPWR